MKSRTLLLLFPIAILALAACGTPGGQIAGENPPVSTAPQDATLQPTESAAQPAPKVTATSLPTLTSTATPLPEIISLDTLSSLQVSRSFSLYPGELADIYLKRFSPNNSMAAVWGCTRERGESACVEPLLVIFDVNTGKVKHSLEPLTTVVKDMAFSPDEKSLAIAGCHTPIYAYGQPDTICDQPKVWMVDTATGEVIREFKGYTSPVNSLVFSPDGKTLYTGIEYFKKYSFTDSTIRSWDVETGEELASIQPDIENCTDVRLSITPGGDYLVTQYINGCVGTYKVKWWNLKNPSPRPVGGGTGFRYTVSPDGSKIAIIESYDNPVLHVYDIAAGQKIKTIPTGLRSGFIPKMAFTPDSNSIALTQYSAQPGEGPAVLDAATGEMVARLNDPKYKISPDAGLVFSPDGKFLFTYGRIDDYLTSADDNGPLIGAWDASTWEKIEIPQPYWYLTPFDTPNFLKFSPDQKSILVNSGLDVTKFGLPIASQNHAKSYLEDHLQNLAVGEYEESAKQIYFSDLSILSGWIESRLPGIDPEDTASVLKALCEDQRFPCLPIKDVLYAGQKDDRTFDFVVDFLNPDGTAAMWPSCEGLSADDYCDFRDGFEYLVTLLDDGTFRIDGTLPYSMWLE